MSVRACSRTGECPSAGEGGVVSIPHIAMFPAPLAVRGVVVRCVFLHSLSSGMAYSTRVVAMFPAPVALCSVCLCVVHRDTLSHDLSPRFTHVLTRLFHGLVRQGNPKEMRPVVAKDICVARELIEGPLRATHASMRAWIETVGVFVTYLKKNFFFVGDLCAPTSLWLCVCGCVDVWMCGFVDLCVPSAGGGGVGSVPWSAIEGTFLWLQKDVCAKHTRHHCKSSLCYFSPSLECYHLVLDIPHTPCLRCFHAPVA